VLLQRVSKASVAVDGSVISSIDRGLLLLVGVGRDDPAEHVERLADKIANLRIFADDEGKMNRALGDVGGEALVVSQFTLYADLSKARRPSWTDAGDPAVAAERVEAFARALEDIGIRVARGIFGADMEVELTNDGPVTIWLDADRP
jgi:D-tyrosyl-tRNA(Tyr) deacylase